MATFLPPQSPSAGDEPAACDNRRAGVLLQLLIITVMGSLAVASGASTVQRHIGPRLSYREISPARAVAEEKGRQPCRRAIAWQHVFPRPYLGDVYAQLSANPYQSTPVHVTLSWGVWRKQSEIIARPGLVNLGLGGTLLLFAKTGGVTGVNPQIDLDANIPVCVRFGTVWDGVPEPSALINANPGWAYSAHGWK